MAAQLAGLARTDSSSHLQDAIERSTVRRSPPRAAPIGRAVELILAETERLRGINREAGKLQGAQAAVRDIDTLLAQAAGLIERAVRTHSLTTREEALMIAGIALRDLDRRSRAAGLGGVPAPQPGIDRASLGVANLDLVSDEGLAQAAAALLLARGAIQAHVQRIDRQLCDLAERIPQTRNDVALGQVIDRAAIARGGDVHPTGEISQDQIDELLQ